MEGVRILLSMTDMLQNCLDTSIQGQCVSLGGIHPPLTMRNFFLIHRWYPEDMLYAFYTDEVFQTLQRIFEHPSVRALQILLKMANGSKMEKI